MRIDESRPIWGQLVDEFRRRIVSGEWPRGSRIPSVRELAVDVGVNPNTVQKALVEIDRDELTIAERTAGRYVTNDSAVIASAREALATSITDAYLGQLLGLGLTESEAEALIARRWAEISASTEAPTDTKEEARP